MIKSTFEKKQFKTHVILKTNFIECIILECFLSQLPFLEDFYYYIIIYQHWQGRRGEGLNASLSESFPSLAFLACLLFSILKAKGERNYTDHLKQQKGKILKINNTTDNGRHQLLPFSDAREASSAFNSQFMNVTD